MQGLNIRLKGLYTHPNPISEVPDGALIRAKNLVLDKEGILEVRRGFKNYGSALTLSGSDKINALFNYNNNLLVHYGTKMAYDSDSAGTWVDYSGTYSAPSGAVNMRSVEANKNFYFTTSAGVKKLDSLTGAVTISGGYKGLDGTVATSGGSGFLANNNQVAYRIVWGITDANNNLILGAPSQRIVLINTSGGSVDASLTFTIPSGITTSHFYQIYRSLASGGAAVVPNDELGLVYEDNPNSAQITAKSVTVVDSVPESLRGATIYTAPSQQGISQANDQPPLCQDIAYFKTTTLFANTLSKQRIILTLLAVGGSTGIAANDTITIGGVLYTAKASEAASSGEFKVTTSGTPAENIDATAQSLVRVINQYASNTQYYAYYLSGYNDLPGKFLIEERSLGGNSYAVIASNGGAFNPSLPTSGTSISSSNETSPNRLYISKSLQPEAVPLANYIDVGSANKEITRIIALRDSVFIFKQDGLYRLTGEDIATYRVSLFDVTVILGASETAVAFDNQIYAYTSQGVVGISDTGSAILSRPVEIDLLPVSTYSDFSSISFGIAYNSDRKYILFIPYTASDTYPTQAYVYNSIVQAWTRWEKNINCGIVNSADDKLYLGSADTAYVLQERKSFTNTDYADRQLSVTITSYSGLVIQVTDTSALTVGWGLSQSSTVSNIVSIDSTTQITIEDEYRWVAGSADVYEPISTEIQTVPQTIGNPGLLKHFRDITVFFRRARFKRIDIGFKSNLSANTEYIEVTPTSEGGWGALPWGSFPWGSTVSDLQTIRTFLPRNKQRSHWVSILVRHATAKDYFAVAGLSLMYSDMSERTK